MEDPGAISRRGKNWSSWRFAITGKGIPEDKLEKIFDPFYTTKREKGGHGLGLRSGQKHHRDAPGKISITNAEGGGALVRIALRCAAEGEDVV